MKWIRLVCMVVISLCAFTVYAQQPSKGTMDAVRDALKAQKKAFVGLNMQLTKEEDSKFWSVYDSYQKDLDAVNKKIADVIIDYVKNYEKMTDEKACKLIKSYLAAEGELLKLKESYLPKFSAVLSQKKVARYYQLENKIQAVIRYDLADEIPLVK